MIQPLPEPTNVGPIAGGNLRASDADREQVATLLSTAYAEGRLTLEEHDDRIDQLMAAKTFDDLIPITRDLVLVGPATPVAPPSREPLYHRHCRTEPGPRQDGRDLRRCHSQRQVAGAQEHPGTDPLRRDRS